MSDQGPIRTAVVGLGRSGYNVHIKALRRLPDWYRLVAVADRWPERSSSVAAELGAIGYTDIEGLLDDPNVELVVIATPNDLHTHQTVAALYAGKHVICDKPFGLSGADARLMEKISKERGLNLSAYFSRRYEQSFRKTCEVIASGILGNITHVRTDWSSFGRRWDWQTLKEFGGGQFNNNFPHALDQGLQILEAAGHFSHNELELSADIRNTFGIGDADDHVRVALRVPLSGMTLEIEMLSTQAFPGPRLIVCGTRGGLRGDATTLEWKWIAADDWPIRHAERHSDLERKYRAEELLWQSETFTCHDEFSDWQRHFYEDFYHWARLGREPLVSLASACQSAEIMDRLRELSIQDACC